MSVARIFLPYLQLTKVLAVHFRICLNLFSLLEFASQALEEKGRQFRPILQDCLNSKSFIYWSGLFVFYFNYWVGLFIFALNY